MITSELQKAIDNLQIQDVYLRNVVARCIGDFDPKYYENLESLSVQIKHHVKEAFVVKLEDEVHLLRVYVDLGARWVDESIEVEADSILALVEAEFVAEYSMKEMLEKACIDEFSLKNVSYHVWPYWREFLSSQCERMHLPKVMLPAVQLAHNRLVDTSQDNKEVVKEKK